MICNERVALEDLENLVYVVIDGAKGAHSVAF
jgi:hypothetical protein